MESMDNRTRIIETIRCRPVDRLPFFFCFGPWPETLRRWNREGLPPGKPWWEDFGFDPGIITVRAELGLCPFYPEIMLENRGDTYLCRDRSGITKLCRKDGGSIPRFLDYPVKNMDDWQQLKNERLQAGHPGRFPGDWPDLACQWNQGAHIVQAGRYPWGLFGTARDLMGVEALMIAFYEQPELIHDIMDTLTDLWLTLYAQVIRDVRVDAIHLWEDMSGKQGSLISPAMIEEFMLPNYRKISRFAKENGIPVFSVDTDGDVRELVPLFLSTGVNLIFPFEVAAGCDINEYRRQYPNLGIMGGIDKQKIALGPKSIDTELKRIEGMFRHSGFIPSLDHLIHPEISWADFQYFITRLREMIFRYAGTY